MLRECVCVPVCVCVYVVLRVCVRDVMGVCVCICRVCVHKTGVGGDGQATLEGVVRCLRWATFVNDSSVESLDQVREGLVYVGVYGNHLVRVHVWHA